MSKDGDLLIHRRIASIDVLRGLAILFMIFVHFTDYLSPDDAVILSGAFGGFIWDIIDYVGELSAPLFLFLFALSYVISSYRMRLKTISNGRILWFYIFHGLILFLIGLGTNFLKADSWDFDILLLIGVSFVVLSLIDWIFCASACKSHIKIYICAILIITVLVFSPLFRVWFGYPETVVDDSFINAPSTFHEFLLHALCRGYFPLFPWLAFVIAGYIAGIFVCSREEEHTEKRYLSIQGVVLFISIMILAVYFGSKQEISFYPASTALCCIQLGACIMTFCFLFYVQDVEGLFQKGRFFRFLRRLSLNSLTLYVLHYSLVTLISETGRAYHTMIFESSLGLALLFVILSYALILWKEKSGRKIGLEYVLRFLNPMRRSMK